jgi:hypothetical protein
VNSARQRPNWREKHPSIARKKISNGAKSNRQQICDEDTHADLTYQKAH